MKFLKAVRLDVSDSKIFAAEGALEDGEWVVSGGYAVCDLASGGHQQPGCRCDVSFIGLQNRKRCTLAEVVEIDEATYRRQIEILTRHFLEDRGAPSREVARSAAEEEVSYTAELCESFPRPQPDGTTELRLTPLELIDRLAALIPPPRLHRHRYHGVLASPIGATAAFGQRRWLGQ